MVQVLCDLHRKTDSDSSSIPRLLFYSIHCRASGLDIRFWGGEGRGGEGMGGEGTAW